MAKTMYLAAMALVFVFNLLIGSTVLAGRNLHSFDGIKHPDKFFYHDRGYLIPGIGRGIKPKSKKGFNPFTYNPITGSNNGFPGVTIPSVGGSRGNNNYVPGGDDTLLPNPGVEVPNPAGNTPIPTNP